MSSDADALAQAMAALFDEHVDSSDERELSDEALTSAEAFTDIERWPVMVLAGQGWHQCVSGLS